MRWKILFSFGLLAAFVAAAVPELALREWHAADGLPSDETSRVIQTRDGFLWVLTSGGLARFDGAQFETRLPLDPAGRRVTLSRALAETAELGLVLAPAAGGLVAWRNGAFHTVALPGAAPRRPITTLFAESSETLWGGDDDGAVLRWHRGASEIFSTTDNLNGRPVFSFATDGEGRVWVANGVTLARHTAGKLEPMAFDLGGSELRIGSSRRDGPWIATQDRLFKVVGGRPEARLPLPALVSAHYIQTLVEDRAGALWIGTRSQGVYLFTGGELHHVPTTNEDILSLCEDTEGDMWVATNGGGLNRLRPRVFQLFDKSAGLRDNFSDTVCEDAGGTMWFGNRDGGVARVRDGAIELVPPPPEWPVISAVSVAPDPRGSVWATAGPGLFKIEERPALAMRQIALPPLPIIRCTYVSRRGELWFSADPDRLGRLVGEKLELFGREAGFEGRQVRFITEDAEGKIWCGTADEKVFRQTGDRFARVPLEIPTGTINAVHVDRVGTVWLCTAESGLVVRTADGWRVLDASRGLPDNSVTQMLDDERGNFWFGSGRGIFRVSQPELAACLAQPARRVHAVLIGKDEGLKDIACLGYFQPAAWKSRDGRLWFTTRRGVLRLDPALAIPEAPPPPVQIREVTADDHHLLPAAGLELTSTLRKIEFRFSVLCLATPERVRVKYRLDGFDDDWVAANSSYVATYPRLPPGRYQFRVQAEFGDDAREAQRDALAFAVVPHWWQTGWFRFCTVVALATAIALVVRAWSHRRLRARLEKLERESAVERERTRIAQNIHDDLGAGLTRISLLTQSAEHAAAGAAQFEKIYTTVSELTRSMDEIVWAVNPKNDDLDNLAYYLGNFAQSFLADARIRCRLLMPDQLPRRPLPSQMRHHLFLCCKEALHNVVKHARAREVSLAIATDGDRLTIAITDDGRGLAASASPRTGNGLANLRARMAELGGTCEIAPGPGGGTVVTFAVTLPAILPLP